jgi:predicted NUDIX family phosphoesterase
MSVDPAKSNGLRLILATKTEGLPEQLRSTQFLPMPHSQAIETLEGAGLWLGPRPALEETEEFRQIIPYIVLQYGSEFIRYTRTPAGGEARLHGRISVGLGGHVDLTDVEATGETIDLIRTLENAADRELLEELGDVEIESKAWVGLLVENESAVGRVHIGMVGLWRLRSLPAGIAEDAIGQLSSTSVAELEADADRLETWSAMLLPWLTDVVFEREAAFLIILANEQPAGGTDH